ncbi:MAG: lytic transglycosylase domain-containing protein [Kordiimonadaceae bacterium]|nr:lytic transglycosylase domain-containing protein [Kordiimonadaceae bacterium]MBO6569077.1 lytic transglycosylase domain-containing protein [Kordiimonadaceae bacterium]MBO6964552.1 lytic transglycosylase domain-containing protein [Kordiimonadaceae bacterium]
MIRVSIKTFTVLLVVLAGCISANAQSASIPTVLSEKDIERYQRIFELQQQAQWDKAQREIDRLENPILMGHVNFQKLMHPTGYRSKYSELAAWMKRYADHPNAWRVYRLAKRRQGKARSPRVPDKTRYPGVTGQSALPKPPLPRRSRLERKAITTFFANIRRYVRNGTPERAEKRYWAMDARGLLVPHEKAQALERIAASYYYEGDDFRAMKLSELGANFSREIVPQVDWIAGLAHWRRGDLEAAYRHFDALANSERAGDWLLSAGSYWAARAALRLGDVAGSTAHLKTSASFVETFYGLIANRQLGIEPSIDWSVPPLQQSAVDQLLKYPATRRAIALVEVGRDDVADEELRLLWGREGVGVQEDMLSFATALNLPAIQIRLGRAGGTGDPAPIATRYPMPNWVPAGGFSVDRAMIFAMVRKESDFRSRARSHAGANGLMQVTASTASYITNNRSLLRRANRSQLYEPEFNIALGQQYIEYLMGTQYVEDNLLMALAAYNGGPGSLLNWRREVDFGVDPLLFIESISFYETRSYIERVMANLWLYRMRLGQPTPSLDTLASGAWPTLNYLDTDETPAAHQRAIRLTHNASTSTADD